MEPVLLQKMLTDLNVDGFLEENAKNAFTYAIKSIIDHVIFKLDPWGRTAYKKRLINELKAKQIEFFSQAMNRVNDIKVNELNKINDERKIMQETLKYLNNPVFIEFVQSLKTSKYNWKGKSKNNNKYSSEDESWWDTFCDLMNKRHEPWRAKLLAEALKIQTTGIGSVSITTIWKIASLPPHSWEDLTQFLSLAGEIWVNGEYKMTVIPGAYSKISQLDYSVRNDMRRLVSDLDTSLNEDGLTRSESGPIVLSRNDENVFKLNGKEYKMITSPNYEDPFFTDEDIIDKDFMKSYFRFYGIWLSYIGEEIVQLAVDISVHEEAELLFEKCKIELLEDGLTIEESGMP
jgi:hypothetical protein